MYYYYGTDYQEAITNEPINIESTKVLESYRSAYSVVIPAEEYLVMYWDDENDKAVAVFNIIAQDEADAEEIAEYNGGDAYAEYPSMVELKEDWETEVEQWKEEGIYKEVR